VRILMVTDVTCFTSIRSQMTATVTVRILMVTDVTCFTSIRLIECQTCGYSVADSAVCVY